MSGTMMPPGMPVGGPPMQPPPMGGPMGGMGGQGMPQLPPQVLQMLMQKMQGGGAPGGPPMQGQQGPPGGGMQGGMQGAPPSIPQPGQAQQMAQQGRFGDSIVAHVTPGEISIPPQIQTPQMIEMLRHAFAQAGVRLEQFTAGSPQASRNPATGAPELSIWASLLPIIGAIGGSVIPGLGTAAGAALGGAAGGAAGGLIDHQSGLGVGLSALGGAAGGYLGAPAEAAGGTVAPALSSTVSDAAISGGAGSGASSALAAPAAGAAGGTAAAAAPNAFAAPAAGAASGNTSMLGQTGSWIKGNYPTIKMGLAAGTGAGLGGMLAPPPTSDPLGAAGFHKPLGPVNPNFNQVRGSGQTSTPSFAGYNPYNAVTGQNPGFNFFPQQ